MSDFQILDANKVSWQDYRDLRLEALRKEPRAYASTYASQKNDQDEVWQERLKKYQEADGNWMAFASDGQQLVGMLGAYQTDEDKKENCAQLIAMYVNENFRGKGIGKLLMNRLLGELTKSGIHKAILEVHSIQTPAVKLYESCGFQIFKTVKFDLGNGNFDDDYVMEKVLV